LCRHFDPIASCEIVSILRKLQLPKCRVDAHDLNHTTDGVLRAGWSYLKVGSAELCAFCTTPRL
jgi:hypothetical protein